MKEQFLRISQRISHLQGGQLVDLEEWELRLLLKVYRPVRGLVRWVKITLERYE